MSRQGSYVCTRQTMTPRAGRPLDSFELLKRHPSGCRMSTLKTSFLRKLPGRLSRPKKDIQRMSAHENRMDQRVILNSIFELNKPHKENPNKESRRISSAFKVRTFIPAANISGLVPRRSRSRTRLVPLT